MNSPISTIEPGTVSSTPATLTLGSTKSGNRGSKVSSSPGNSSTVHFPTLKPCPAWGTGVHKWVFYAACRCVEAGLTDTQAEPFIEGQMTREPNPSNEIDSALAAARGVPGERHPKWPERKRARIIEIAQSGPGLEGLKAMSPVKFIDDSRHSEQVIDTLFPGNPLLCVGSAQYNAVTRTREEWRGQLSRLQFMVPNPMSKRTGVTKSGKAGSPRTEDNTGPRRFLIVECDFKEKDSQGRDTADAKMLRKLAQMGITIADLSASIIHHLKQYLPLALVVYSGGKSHHGWFYVDGQSEEDLRRFMRYAVSLGADDRMWQRCQLGRLPDGTRDNGKRQSIVYFAPEVTQ